MASAASADLPQFKGRAGWEFTDISALDLAAYEPAPAGDSHGAESLFSLEPAGLPDGVIVTSIAEAAGDPRFGSLLSGADDAFVALNEQGSPDGTFVYVPAGVGVEQPISLQTVQSQSKTILNQRTLVVLEEGARAEVWEEYTSAEPELDAVFNIVTELVVGANAHLRYVCGQDLSEKSWVFGAQRASVDRDGSLDWVALGFGSIGGHVRMETRLAGPGADARVTGAYASHGRQHIDFDTTQEHAAPSTTSDLAFRGVLQGRSSAVWKGNIIVDPGAQKTDAFQESRNLLLSKRAHADAIPGLEIQANDVRCTHAAAIAQVDPEQLYYLRSHGLPESDAKRLVIEGFLAALVERFEAGAVREVLGDVLERRLDAILSD
ncbi:MAG TPA: Fe-S cluster assembly protein SufD [Solirubrobacteraceae bacterium]|nr:Fe-S cluster assembly protein SufD [Solirubrobacteraceae bacterium]